MSEPSILDARLAAIDRRLRMIQSGLEPPVSGASSPPAPPPPSSAPPSAAVSPVAPAPEVAAAPEVASHPAAPAAESWSQSVGPPGPGPVAAAPVSPEPPGARTPAEADEADHLISRLRDLVADQEHVLASVRELQSALAETLTAGPSPSAPAEPSAPSAGSVTVSAGPFADTESLRSFERDLWSLPGVRDVILRGYEGADHAVVEVALAGERLGTDAPPTS